MFMKVIMIGWRCNRILVMMLQAASNTFPNLMILHTGKRASTYHLACKWGMDSCNEQLMIWSKFKKSGYFTGYGEDHFPDTYSDLFEFKELPTDHYTRLLFGLGANEYGNIKCLKHKPSAHHVLDYAYQFVKAYKEENFFGFFWLSSYSHNPNHIPTLLQNALIRFFENINRLGALNNTIVIFLGDHGIRYGPQKIPVESYYDERLPMLFMKFPRSFQERHEMEFSNLVINQHRLTSHCDLHSTLWNILKLSDRSVRIIPPEFCPQCSSLFEEKSINRRCEDMEVTARWCSCNTLQEVDSTDIAEYLVPQILLYRLVNLTGNTDLQIKSVLRHHWFRYKFDYDDNITYYLIAVQMEQNNVQYESIIKRDQMDYEIVEDIFLISPYGSFINVTNCTQD